MIGSACGCLLSSFIVVALSLQDPTNVNAYFNRGSAYDSMGDYTSAVSDYTKALEMDESSKQHHQGLGGHP